MEYKNGGEAPTFWFPPKPSDDENSHEYLSWLLAKLYFRSSNMQVDFDMCWFYNCASTATEMINSSKSSYPISLIFASLYLRRQYMLTGMENVPAMISF